MASVTDGTSKTLLLGEKLIAEDWTFLFDPYTDGPNHWAKQLNGSTVGVTIIPINWRTDYTADDGCDVAQDRYYKNWAVSFGFKSYHPGGANFALADGSVRFFQYSAGPTIITAMSTRALGEVISE